LRGRIAIAISIARTFLAAGRGFLYARTGKKWAWQHFPAPVFGRALSFEAGSSLNHGAPQAQKIDYHMQSAVQIDEEERSNCMQHKGCITHLGAQSKDKVPLRVGVLL
jgi:hypothetical protein